MSNNPYSIDRPAEQLFYGRQAQVEKITVDLTTSAAGSYALIGGRRFGKTSLLHAIESRLWSTLSPHMNAEYYVIPVYLNLLGDKIVTLEDFFVLVADILKDLLSKYYHELLLDTELNAALLRNPSSPTHRLFASQLIELCQSASRKGSPLRILLLLDETEEILDRPWRHDLFNRLRWLIYENEQTRSHLKIILAGSSGFYNDVNQRSSPLWGVLRFECLAAFPEDETVRLIQEPCNGQIPEMAVREIIRYSGGHPYLTQYLMHHLWQRNLPEISPQNVLLLAERFMRESWSQLDGWRKSIGEMGCQAYAILSSRDDWQEEDIIRQGIGGPNSELVPALTALCYHGLAVHDDSWRYRAVGDIFRKWFAKNVTQKLVRNEIKERNKAVPMTVTLQKSLAAHWWFKACLGGIASGILVFLLAFLPERLALVRVSVLVATAVTIFLLLHNPQTRFMKAFWAVFSVFSVSNAFPALKFWSSWNQQNSEGTPQIARIVDMVIEGPSWHVNFCLVVLMIVLLWLDQQERNRVHA